MTGVGPTAEPAVARWEIRALDEVLARLLGAAPPPSRGACVVAIDGRSASGKTALARRLVARHPAAALVSTDDVAWYESFFGWDRLLAEHVLAPARDGRPVAWRPPAWDERGREGAISVPEGTRLLVVEGVGAGRRELAGLVDAIAWVQCDAGLARARGIERDGGDERARAFWDEWQAEEVPFLEADRPWTRAVVVVSGTPDLPHDPEREVQAADGPLA